MLNIKIINKSEYEAPKYETEQSAGVDLRANIDEEVILYPMERKLIPTGIFIELPKGYEAQIRPRSGLAAKHGITVLNSPGTIDADYRGEIMVLLINQGDAAYTIVPGERIAQMVIAKHEQVEWVIAGSLDETERGEGGFGHTKKD